MANELIDYETKWGAAAEAAAAEEPARMSGVTISTKGGVLSVDGVAMPGNQMAALVIDATNENLYFADKWTEGVTQAPKCYAFGRGKEEMAPHPSMAAYPDTFEPQHDTCTGCPMGEFGSSETGKGRACKQTRKLILLLAGVYSPRPRSRDFDLDLFMEEQHFAEADPAFLRLPVTSVNNWVNYVNQLTKSVHRPPYGVFTRVYVEPHPKNQYEVKFELIQPAPEEFYNVLTARHEDFVNMPFQGYQPPQQPEAAQAAGKFRRPGA
jgi:hypothetical protein